MLVDTERAADLDTVMDKMLTGDDGYRYSVAWIDCQSTGSRLGRSVLTRGDHARLEDLPERLRRAPDRARAFVPRTLARVPVTPPGGLLNPLTVGAFNEFWFRKAPLHQVAKPHHMTGFFHPLDGVGDWNRLYGRKGFLQYQFVVPDRCGETVRTVIERLTVLKLASFLAVLKRFGPGDPGPLSFPMPGWTLALDLPGRSSWTGPSARRPRRAGAGRRRPGLPGQGLRVSLPPRSGPCTPGSTSGRSCGTGWIPAGVVAVRPRTTTRAVHRCPVARWGQRRRSTTDKPLPPPGRPGPGPPGPPRRGSGRRRRRRPRPSRRGRRPVRRGRPRRRDSGDHGRPDGDIAGHHHPIAGQRRQPTTRTDGIMIDAIGRPQSVLVLGGSSEIAQAIVAQLVPGRCRTVVLAGREGPRLTEAVDRAKAAGADVAEAVAFDATEPDGHRRLRRRGLRPLRRHRPGDRGRRGPRRPGAPTSAIPPPRPR